MRSAMASPTGDFMITRRTRITPTATMTVAISGVRSFDQNEFQSNGISGIPGGGVWIMFVPLRGAARFVSLGPEPAEHPGGQEPVDEAVHRDLHGRHQG